MKNIIVLYENGTTGNFTTYPANKELLQKISGKIFKDKETLEHCLMVASRNQESYVRGLGCPRDAKVAFATIENAKKFKSFESVIVEDTRDQLKESIKKFNELGRKIVLLDMSEKNVSGKMKWVAEVIEIIA